MQSAEVMKVKLSFSLLFLDTFFIHLFSFLSEETHLHHLHFFNPPCEGYFITQCLHQTGRWLSFCYLLGEACLLTLKSHSAVILQTTVNREKVFLSSNVSCHWGWMCLGPVCWWTKVVVENLGSPFPMCLLTWTLSHAQVLHCSTHQTQANLYFSIMENFLSVGDRMQDTNAITHSMLFFWIWARIVSQSKKSVVTKVCNPGS